MWMADPRPDAQTQRTLSHLPLDQLMGDIETVQAMLTYGAAKTQQAFATPVPQTKINTLICQFKEYPYGKSKNQSTT